MADFDHDYLIIGSGFGGSPCALRLVEKGYDVLLLEKGSELGPEDFPETNWNLRKWMWIPWIGFRGLFRISFFRHVSILTGVGVGGGSLGYACTHPVPADSFFEAGSWTHLASWKEELAPHYEQVKHMLGVARVPFLTPPDKLLQTIAEEDGKPEAFHNTDVAVYFGKPGETVADPYFGGTGPERTGCIKCGGCMLGCRHGAKNSLDKNYLHFARQKGLELQPDTEVTRIEPLDGGGYRVESRVGRHPMFRRRQVHTARNVIVAAGVLGTLLLLHRQKKDRRCLPKISDRLGEDVRTNEEAIIYMVTRQREVDYSHGVAIGSIYQTDENSHIEVVRYSRGSGFFRLLMTPHATGDNLFTRLMRVVAFSLRHPIRLLQAVLVPDLARYSTVLLYMRTTESTLRMKKSWMGNWLTSRRSRGPAPRASMPEATAMARRVEDKADGYLLSGVTETLFNIPTTAHILGGCCMGDSPENGVIDSDHRVFGYEGLYVIDGSAVSANPGVNPSLTIAALAERAMEKIPAKAELGRNAEVTAATASDPA